MTITDPDRTLVRNWLYFICLLVFAMVIVGGATRLTDSGLSITEWKPILGAIPPLSAADWEIAFEKYRLIPEYQQVNSGMSMDEFKFIFWWEWGHRFLGRFIGLAVFIPLVFFWVTGRLTPKLKPRLVILFLLGGLQGFIGWWMVKSGLVDRVDVSQYRLAAHLTLACIIFAYCLWIARGLAQREGETTTRRLHLLAWVIFFAILFQIFLGALVAGQHAGRAFNDWPLMDGVIIPSDLFLQQPFWINFFENGKTVQFVHRIGAYAVVLLVLTQMIFAMRAASSGAFILRTIVMSIFVFLQAAIGIITLVLVVPLDWALLHQGGAVILLAASVWHLRAIKGGYA